MSLEMDFSSELPDKSYASSYLTDLFWPTELWANKLIYLSCYIHSNLSVNSGKCISAINKKNIKCHQEKPRKEPKNSNSQLSRRKIWEVLNREHLFWFLSSGHEILGCDQSIVIEVIKDIKPLTIFHKNEKQWKNEKQ